MTHFSQPNQVEDGVGSGTSDYRSHAEPPKKWQLRNTALLHNFPSPQGSGWAAVLLTYVVEEPQGNLVHVQPAAALLQHDVGDVWPVEPAEQADWL